MLPSCTTTVFDRRKIVLFFFLADAGAHKACVTIIHKFDFICAAALHNVIILFSRKRNYTWTNDQGNMLFSRRGGVIIFLHKNHLKRNICNSILNDLKNPILFVFKKQVNFGFIKEKKLSFLIEK